MKKNRRTHGYLDKKLKEADSDSVEAMHFVGSQCLPEMENERPVIKKISNISNYYRRWLKRREYVCVFINCGSRD